MIRSLIVTCFLLLMLSCTQSGYVQDEQMAIEVANKFIKAIMQQSYQEAYDQYLSAGIKFGPKSTIDYFKADWEAIRNKFGVIQKATFSAWQPVPGKRAIQLYYDVSHKNVKEKVVYHIVLEGYQKRGYTIFLVDIGNEQRYPANATNLPPKQTIEKKIEILP